MQLFILHLLEVFLFVMDLNVISVSDLELGLFICDEWLLFLLVELVIIDLLIDDNLLFLDHIADWFQLVHLDLFVLLSQVCVFFRCKIGFVFKFQAHLLELTVLFDLFNCLLVWPSNVLCM